MSSFQEQVNLHVNDFNNPHNVTKEQLGLSHIENYPIATKEEALAGTLSNRYLTPERLKDVFNGALQSHGLMSESNQPIVIIKVRKLSSNALAMPYN